MNYKKLAKVSDSSFSGKEVVKVHNSDEASEALGSGKTIDTSEWEDEDYTVDDFFIAFEDFQLGDAPEPMHIEYNGDLATLVFGEESDEDISDSALSDNWIKIKRGLTRTLGGDYKLGEGVTEDRIEITPEGGIIEGLTADDIIDYVVNNFPFEFDGMHGDTFIFLKKKVNDSKLSFRQRVELRKMIKDAFSQGDIYNDGQTAGRIARVENDYIVVETQNEEGDVQNVEVPIEDFLDINAGINGDVDVETEDVNTNVTANRGFATQDSAELPAKPEEQFEEPTSSDIVDSVEDEDEVDIHRAAIDALTEQNITDIYDNGFTIIDVPSEVEDLDEFAKECADEAQNLADKILGAEDIGASEILSAVEDGQIVLYVAQ